MPSLPLLSTGQQEFATLRETQRVYVDKTDFIHKLFTHSSYFFFLSRPRRFGKSLLVNTLKELFLGRKELFEGLFIYDKIDWKTHPVIHIDCSKLGFKDIGLQDALCKRLDEIAQNYQLSLQEKGIGLKFAELIKKLHLKTDTQVAILIDEYDKPITDVLEQGDNAQAHLHREMLRTFYSIVKGSSAHIRFFFLTGITRFSKVSLFSDLNNLVDISFHKDFHNLLGYTQAEIQTYFSAHLEAVGQENGKNLSEIWELVKRWYNGYSWNGSERLYNPFSILCFLDEKRFRNFWFESGTPKMLVNLLKKEGLYNLQNIRANMGLINNFDIDNLNAETLLFQTGYLTISSFDEFGDFILNYPNHEVELSMTQYLLGAYTYQMRHSVTANQIAAAIKKHDFDLFIDTINILFADISAEIFLSKKEAYYHSVLFLAIKLAGFHIVAEVRSSKGRIDAVLGYENRIYLFEFKLDQDAQNALQQIEQKEYFKKFLQQDKDIFLVGINFSSSKKEVDNWIVKKIEL
jgi:hypothetical protein